MEFKTEFEVRNQVARYLAREISVEEFEDWFAPRSWDFLREPSRMQDLVATIDLLLVEFQERHRTEEQLREDLRPLVTHYEIDIVEPQMKFTGTSVGVSELPFLLSPATSEPVFLPHQVRPSDI